MVGLVLAQVLSPFGAGAASFWRRCCILLAQVLHPFGAGAASFWRRCGFWVGTCARKWTCTHCSGAGLAPFSTPAPFTPRTCATKAPHLRQKPHTPAPNWGQGRGKWGLGPMRGDLGAEGRSTDFFAEGEDRIQRHPEVEDAEGNSDDGHAEDKPANEVDDSDFPPAKQDPE